MTRLAISQELYDTLGTTLFVVADNPEHSAVCGSCGVSVLYAPCRVCGATWTRITNLSQVSGWTDARYRAACREIARELLLDAQYVQRGKLLPGDILPYPEYRGVAVVVE